MGEGVIKCVQYMAWGKYDMQTSFWFFSRLCNYSTIKLQCYIVDRRDKDDSKYNADYDDDDVDNGT